MWITEARIQGCEFGAEDPWCLLWWSAVGLEGWLGAYCACGQEEVVLGCEEGCQGDREKLKRPNSVSRRL